MTYNVFGGTLSLTQSINHQHHHQHHYRHYYYVLLLAYY